MNNAKIQAFLVDLAIICAKHNLRPDPGHDEMYVSELNTEHSCDEQFFCVDGGTRLTLEDASHPVSFKGVMERSVAMVRIPTINLA